MSVTIRVEQEEDWPEVEALTRAAFWNDEKFRETGLGCDEHYLAHELRSAPEFVAELDLVAVVDGRIVGNIMYMQSFIKGDDGSRQGLLTFGPLSVLPKYQKQGYGKRLVTESLERAAQMGFSAVAIYGHPTYYPRFGFRDAVEFGITTADGSNFPAFMALELSPGALKSVSGAFILPDVYNVDQEAAKKFDRPFAE